MMKVGHRSSYFGINAGLALPKDRFYLYRSRWNERINPSYFATLEWEGREGQTTPFCVHKFQQC
jgi:beta-galactosidase